jgi:hypothetical protein
MPPFRRPAAPVEPNQLAGRRVGQAFFHLSACEMASSKTLPRPPSETVVRRKTTLGLALSREAPVASRGLGRMSIVAWDAVATSRSTSAGVGSDRGRSKRQKGGRRRRQHGASSAGRRLLEALSRMARTAEDEDGSPLELEPPEEGAALVLEREPALELEAGRVLVERREGRREAGRARLLAGGRLARSSDALALLS